MTRNIAAWVVSAVAIVLPASGAAAQGCGNPRLLSSTDLVPIPGDSRMLAPVTINGVEKKLLLDTAGGRTSLTQAAINALQIRPSYSSQVKLVDANGNSSHRFFNIDSLVLGSLRTRTQLMVTPDDRAGIAPAFDGILAADLMNHYDVEIDFSAHKLNYFSQDHCDGRTVYWQADNVGSVPITVRKRSGSRSVAFQTVLFGVDGTVNGFGIMPATGSAALTDSQGDEMNLSGLDLRTNVTIDGRKFTAIIDTGAAISTMSEKIADAAFGVTAASPDSMTRAANSDDSPWWWGSRAFDHRFHILSFGDVTVANPRFTVHPDRNIADNDDAAVTGSRLGNSDSNAPAAVTIGMDVLSKLHLYIAFREGKLYLTANGQKEKS